MFINVIEVESPPIFLLHEIFKDIQKRQIYIENLKKKSKKNRIITIHKSNWLELRRYYGID